MQPLKITLLGDYYDCQLYRGRLYLWTFDGDLRIYNWDQVIDKVVDRNGDWLSFLYGYKDGRYLYGSKTKQLFEDDEFKQIVIRRYASSHRRKHVLSEKDIEDCMIGQQSAPSSSLPIDTEIYNNNLYYSTEKGLFKATAHRPKSEKYKVSTKSQQIWDARVLSIIANDYPQIAISAGSDGLYEYRPGSNYAYAVLKEIEPQLYRVSERFSLFSNYVYESIFSSSHSGNSYISMFKLDRDKHSFFHRVFEKELGESVFYDESKKDETVLSWGIRDKIYQATGNEMHVLKFSKWSENKQEDRFNSFGSLKLKEPSRLVKGGAASFGNILEYEDGLLVMMSNNEKFWLPEEVTRWRIYPRSINYLNQLHVILEDRIEFYSFNHDSNVNQSSKLNGIEYYVPTSKQSRNIRPDIFDELYY